MRIPKASLAHSKMATRPTRLISIAVESVTKLSIEIPGPSRISHIQMGGNYRQLPLLQY